VGIGDSLGVRVGFLVGFGAGGFGAGGFGAGGFGVDGVIGLVGEDGVVGLDGFVAGFFVGILVGFLVGFLVGSGVTGMQMSLAKLVQKVKLKLGNSCMQHADNVVYRASLLPVSYPFVQVWTWLKPPLLYHWRCSHVVGEGVGGGVGLGGAIGVGLHSSKALLAQRLMLKLGNSCMQHANNVVYWTSLLSAS